MIEMGNEDNVDSFSVSPNENN